MKFKRSLMVSALCIVMLICAFCVTACVERETPNPCADGHDYGSPTWQWNKVGDSYNVTATFACSRDASHTEVKVATVTSANSGDACVDGVSVTYTAKVTFNAQEYVDTKSNVVSQASGHDWDDGVWAWVKSGESYKATLTLTCSHNPQHTLIENAIVTKAHNAATCDKDETNVFTADVTINGSARTDVKTDKISDKLGHDWDEAHWAWVKTASGGYSATVSVACKRDSTHSVNQSATVTKSHLDPTCSVQGYDSYTAEATVNGVKITNVKKDMLATVDHSFKVVEAQSTQSTCYSKGETVYKCETCTESYKETKPLLAHNWDYDEVTCQHGQTCQNQGCKVTRPALSHNYTSKVTVVLDCEHNETTTYTCSLCKDHYDVITRYTTGHTVTQSWTVDGDRTAVAGEACKFNVNYTSTCDVCKQPVTKQEVMEIHAMTASISQAATCSQEGTKLFSCANCRHTETEKYSDVNAHSWVRSDVATFSDSNVVTYVCEHCENTKQVVSYENATNASVDKETLANAGEIALKDASIALDKDTLNALSGTVNISANILDEEALNNLKVDQSKISGNVYDFTLLADNLDSGNFAGKVTVSIPYELSEGEDPDCIAILYINDEGEVETYQAKYSNGYAVFETSHFSYYTVTRLSPSDRCRLYGHIFKEKRVDATCVSDGYVLKVCNRCGETVRKVTEQALGHDLAIDKSRSSLATCTNPGLTVAVCANGCGLESKTIQPAFGHDWQRTDYNEATCTKAGKEVYVCSHDETHTYTTTLVQKDHSYQSVVTVPTCTERGYTTFTCDKCQYSYVGNYRAATGHSYVETTVAPTCFANGYVLHKCSACDDEYRTDEVAARHVWNMDAPTCGEDKVCVICGTVGDKATGNHTMSNGVCTVCGQGCDHAGATTDVVKPTCTEIGYTLNSCTKCGLETKTDYVAATGHVGNTTCSVCEERLINEQFFTNALNSILNLDYAVTLTDVTISAAANINIHFGELHIGIDDDGKLFGMGSADVTVDGDDYIVAGQIKSYAVIKDGVLYAQLGASGMNVNNYNGLHQSTEPNVMYVKMDVDDLYGVLFGSASENAVKLINWIQGDAVPLLKSIIDGNKTVLNNLGFDFVDMLFTVNKTSNGLDLSLNINKLQRLSDALYSKTIGAAIDDVLGAGTFDKVVSLIEKALGCTVGRLTSNIDMERVTLVLDHFAQIIYEDESYTFAQLVGWDKSIADIVAENSSRTLFEVITALVGSSNNRPQGPDVDKPVEPSQPVKPVEPDKEPVDKVKAAGAADEAEQMTLDSFIDMLLGYKNKKLYVEIFGEDVEQAAEVKEQVDKVIAQISTFSFNVVTDVNGNVKSVTLKGNCDLFSGTFTVAGTFTPHSDYDAIVQNIEKQCGGIELSKDILVSIYGPDAHYEEDKNGNVTSVEFTLTKRDSDYDSQQLYEFLMRNDRDDLVKELQQFADANNIKVSEIRATIVFTQQRVVSFYANSPVMVSPDCEDFALVSIPTKTSSTSYYHDVAQADISVEYNGKTWNAQVEAKYFYDFDRYYGSTLYFVYNYSDKTLTYTPVYESLHEYVVDESKCVIPNDCTTRGSIYYECSICGYSYVEYFYLPHGTERYEYELRGTDCTEGVLVKGYCSVCDKLTYVDTTFDHVNYTADKTLNLSKFGGCGDCSIVLGVCMCGKNRNIYVEGMDYEKEGYGEFYVCSKHCGMTVRFVRDYEDVGCKEIVKTTAQAYFNGELVNSEITLTIERDNHEYQRVAHLIDGAKTCEDGWVESEICVKCGKVLYASNIVRREHEEHYIRDIVNLSDRYGADNDGVILVYGCACGKNTSYVQINGDYSREWDGKNDIYVFTKDGFVIRYIRTSEKDENCIVTDKETYEIGYDSTTDKALDKIEVIIGGGYANHDLQLYSVKLIDGAHDCSEGVICTYKCADCGHEEQDIKPVYDHRTCVKQTIDLKPYGAKCDEVLKISSCACGAAISYEVISTTDLDIDIDDTGRYGDYLSYADGKQLHSIRCAVTSPKCDLQLYYIRYVVDDASGDPIEYRELVTDVNVISESEFTYRSLDVTIYKDIQHNYHWVTETKDCITTEKYVCENCGDIQYQHSQANHDYEVISFNAEKGCYGEATLRCTKCGDETTGWREIHEYVEKEEIDGCIVRIVDVCERCGSRNLKETRENHDYKIVGNQEATCTKYSYTEYRCSKCNDEDTYINGPLTHNYVFDEEKGYYVCERCGMQGVNGSDGEVVLEDLTEADGDMYVVGYWFQHYGFEKRNEWEGEYVVNVVIINLDVEDETSNEREVLVENIDINFTDRDQEMFFSKAQAVDFATERGISNYQIRLNVVNRGDNDLVYGITFADLVA